MFAELKRIYYVTPTNFIELLKGYDALIRLKKKEIGDQVTKLSNGLSKLDSAKEEVTVMAGESEEKKSAATEQSKKCEELLINVNKEQKSADEQMKIIAEETKKIEKEKIECAEMAADAE
jgi:dynein heavy chain